MAASGGTAVRRIGRVLTGFGALIVLVGLLAGGPIALLAFAGNPLPDHVPALAEIGTTLTSRDDGQLFLRALALVGWLGWVSFAFSVLVELGAQALRRPAPRLPGMSRQQRAAAALVGSVALILATSPAATAATTAYTAGAWAGAPTTAAAAGSPSAAAAGSAAMSTARAQALAAPAVGPAGMVAAGAAGPVTADRDDDRAEAPVYRVAKGDYLGKVAERYLDEFGDYRELAALNRLRDPDRIRPGQLITLPTEAADQGSRAHATGRLVARVAPPSSPSPAAPERTESRKPSPSPSGSPT
ncbi:LysM peptidoglycan-binding domain-containing protein, partial [Micromonospora endophytica]